MRLTHIIAGILLACSLTSTASAAVLYLKEGEEIECQSFRRQGDLVYATLNADSELMFSVDEVDLKKSGLPREIAPPVAAATRETADASPPQEEAPAGRPFFGIRMPETSTDCTPALQAELLTVYRGYSKAAAAGDFNEFAKFIIAYQAVETRKALAGLSKKELKERRKVLKELSSRDYTARGCLVAQDGETAALSGTGLSMEQGEFVRQHGTIAFKKESAGWKVMTTVWNKNMQ